MKTIAVIAHTGKSLGGGLGELREILEGAGHSELLWYEVAKSKQAPKRARKALDQGADLLFVWGGDGTVRRCIDVLAEQQGAALAILPAGTANLLAGNLDIPQDLARAVSIGLEGNRRKIDTGMVNGEHFAVFAGAGLDALMIEGADNLKDRFGRAAYLWSGARNLGADPVRVRIKVDGRTLGRGKITCLLVGNMSEVLGGIDVFEDSRPDDGILEVGVVTAKSRLQWMRVLAGVVMGRASKSPYATTARGSSVKVRFETPTVYELDGGARKAVKKLTIKVRPESVEVCVPNAGPSRDGSDG